MGHSLAGISAATCITVLLVAGVVAAAPPPAAPAVAPPPTTGPGGPGTHILLAWNDLGMHCYNRDFADIAVLPPFTNLWAQAILIGDPPRVVTTGVTITYSIWDNSNSVGKSNFWTYAQKLFGLAAPLPADVGLTGKKLNDTMDSAPDHFEAVGIPLTEFLDSAPSTPYPYQLAVITLTDSTTSEFLARAVAVAPVSTEMMCSNCHGDTGSATTAYPITPTGKVETNILTLHDYIHQATYPAGHTGPLMDPPAVPSSAPSATLPMPWDLRARRASPILPMPCTMATKTCRESHRTPPAATPATLGHRPSACATPCRLKA